METPSALMDLFARNPLVNGGIIHISLLLAWIFDWTNILDAGGLRRHNAHVTLMLGGLRRRNMTPM